MLVRHAAHIHYRDPAEAGQPACGLDAGDVGQLQEAIRRNLDAETPLLGLAGLEMGEALSAHAVDQDIGGLVMQLRDGAGKARAEFFELLRVHGLG